MRPKVSVLILNYNYGHFLAGAIESALNQDIDPTDMEVLVIDDGSTDNSMEIFAPYCGRARWIGKSNGGQVSAFNTGFTQAAGEFVAILEADDLWEKCKLRKTLARFNENPNAVAAQHWLLQVDRSNKPLPGYDYSNTITEYTLNDVLKGSTMPGTSALTIRADKIRPFIPLPAGMLYGADICLRMIAVTFGPILNIPGVLGKRRIHGNNLFGQTQYDGPVKLQKALSVHIPMIQFYKDIFTRQGLPPDPEFFRRMDIDRLQMEYFLHIYSRRYIAALRPLQAIIVMSGLQIYSLFKVCTLFLAMISPGLYLRLNNLYAATKWAAKLRNMLFPAKIL